MRRLDSIFGRLLKRPNAAAPPPPSRSRTGEGSGADDKSTKDAPYSAFAQPGRIGSRRGLALARQGRRPGKRGDPHSTMLVPTT
jgi:hypothetical protein